MKKWVIIISITLLFLLPAPFERDQSFSQDFPACESFGINKLNKKNKAPHFSLKTLNGEKISLKSLKGKPILLFFWASWCPSCKEEMPLLEKFSEGKSDRLAILTIAIDGEKEKRIQEFINNSKISLPVLLDVEAFTAHLYQVRMVPSAFLIDEEGLMVGKVVGERDWSKEEAWSALKEIFSLH